MIGPRAPQKTVEAEIHVPRIPIVVTLLTRRDVRRRYNWQFSCSIVSRL